MIVLVSLLVGGARCGDGDADGGADAASTGSRDAASFGERGGQCVSECNTAADCCTGPQCGSGIFNYRCDLGRCSQIGCRSDEDCTNIHGGRCGDLSGFGLCGLGCNLPEDCCPPLPPGVVIPDGQDSITVTGAMGQATFYRCGVYPHKYICNTTGISPSDAGAGVCLRVCMGNDDCPGIPFPTADGGTASVRVDGGMVAIPLGDGGSFRIFQQQCVAQFGPIGSCMKGCEFASDCCPDPTGAACGGRQLCVAGTCVRDGCRDDAECSGAGGASFCAPPAAP